MSQVESRLRWWLVDPGHRLERQVRPQCVRLLIPGPETGCPPCGRSAVDPAECDDLFYELRRADPAGDQLAWRHPRVGPGRGFQPSKARLPQEWPLPATEGARRLMAYARATSPSQSMNCRADLRLDDPVLTKVNEELVNKQFTSSARDRRSRH
jgi:hypothetical protein